MSQPRGISDRSGLSGLPNYDTLLTPSNPIQPYSFQVPDCVTAVQELSKLRVLEVVLPCTHDPYSRDSRPVWESRMKEHAINVLENIRGHAKVLKMTSTDVLSGWEDIRDTATQITVIP